MTKKPVKQELSEAELEEAKKLAEADLDNLPKDDLSEAGMLPVDDEEEDGEDEKKEEGCSKSKKYSMKKEKLESIQSFVAEQKDIPQELAEKFITIFEALVTESVNEALSEELESLKEEQEKAIEETVEALAEKVNGFLGLKIDEWLVENKVNLIAEARVQKADAMLEGLKNLFVENNVVYDEKTIDLVEEAEKKVSAIDAKLNEAIETNISLKKKIDEQAKQIILKEMSNDLSMTQSEKLASLISEADALSPQEYEVKLKTLKESLFVEKQKQPQTQAATVVSKKNMTFAEMIKNSIIN